MPTYGEGGELDAVTMEVRAVHNPATREHVQGG